MPALSRCKDGVGGSMRARAVRLNLVEGPRRRKALQHAFVDRTRVDAMCEVGEIAEGPTAARPNDRLDRLAADALEGAERIGNCTTTDFERHPRPVNGWGIHLDAESFGFAAELRKFLGVAHIESPGGGQESDGTVP